MELGIGVNGQPSWAERMLRLRDDSQLGIFYRLAFLEASFACGRLARQRGAPEEKVAC